MRPELALDIDVRNPVYLANNWIDCEIEHPKLGWIAYTAEANSKDAFMRIIYRKAEKLGPEPYRPPPPSPDQQLAECRRERLMAYRAESDPLFFEAEAGEIERQAWLDKRAEIKKRHPKPKGM